MKTYMSLMKEVNLQDDNEGLFGEYNSWQKPSPKRQFSGSWVHGQIPCTVS